MPPQCYIWIWALHVSDLFCGLSPLAGLYLPWCMWWLRKRWTQDASWKSWLWASWEMWSSWGNPPMEENGSMDHLNCRSHDAPHLHFQIKDLSFQLGVYLSIYLFIYLMNRWNLPCQQMLLWKILLSGKRTFSLKNGFDWKFSANPRSSKTALDDGGSCANRGKERVHVLGTIRRIREQRSW